MERYEWAHATAGPGLVDPSELAELADDGNPDQDWGLAFSTGSDGCMIFGSPQELLDMLQRARDTVLRALPGEPR